MLSPHKLHVFTVVAQEGQISRAATRLYMTQAAVSQHIHDLESSLGTPLFERHPQGVRLLPRGEVLLGYAEKILRTIAEAERAVTQVDNLAEGALELGFTPMAAAHLSADWLGAFLEIYPRIKVSAHTRSTPQLIQALLDGQVDLIFVEGEILGTPNVQTVELQQTHLYVAVHGEHRWKGRDTVSIDEAVAEPFLLREAGSHTHRWVMDLFARYGKAPQVVAEFDDPATLKRAIIQGLGASFLPACLAHDEEAQGRLHLLPLAEEPGLQRPLRAAWLVDRPPGPVPKAFLDLLLLRYPHIGSASESGSAA